LSKVRSVYCMKNSVELYPKTILTVVIVSDFF
jgi:hypothetical protein